MKLYMKLYIRIIIWYLTLINRKNTIGYIIPF